MKRSRSIRAQIVRLVVAVILPFLVFGALSVIRSADSDQRTIATTVQERAQAAAADLDRELRNLNENVSILANVHYILVNDVALYPRYVTNLLKDPAVGFAVRDISGETLFDTCTADGRPFPLSSGLSDVLYSTNPNRSHISELVAEPISGEPLLTIDLPVWRD